MFGVIRLPLSICSQRLEDEIRTHVLRKGELFKTYLIELRTKMHQAGYREEEELYRAYENMAPEYRLYIKRSEFATLKQLTHMATECESVKQLESIRCGTPGVTCGNHEGSQFRQSPNPFRNSESTTQAGHVTHRMECCRRDASGNGGRLRRNPQQTPR